ncbi:protocadherin beta-14-like isoform X1 [Haliotis rubra]|uniref:protocadherin beta-14-like isoform X1 n=1 Tax=Haliotis rubra TaxID=36100 RepID=UPI001EE59B5C|nr:protocadherin beta-14-like isoform X1 [Haliotis rubra]
MKLLLVSLLICLIFALAICNNAPVFRSRRFLIVREDTKIGTVIGKLTAVDPDGPENLVLNITDDATAELVMLGPMMTDVPIHSSTADIILNTTLDRDYEPSSRKLVFEATDGETTTTVTVTLNIDDVNDNAPQFTQTSYSAKIASTVPVGTVVLIATAVDPDMAYGGTVQYTVVTKDLFAFQAFDVNLYTGLIAVKMPLVTQKGRDLHMKVIATDGGGLQTSVDVTITVT